MRKFLRNDSGEFSGMIQAVILVVITAILVGALLPTALNNTARSTSGNNNYIGGVNISAGGDGVSKAGNWTSTMMTTWDSLPILVALTVLVLFVIFGMRFLKG